MALQGTLETFSLPDVLQLLSSTKKSGCLRVTGDRGTGSVWVAGGKIVGGDASASPHASDGVDVVFELLRFGDGEFVFDEGGEAPSPESPKGVDDTLTAANMLLDEWKEIESVVPSSEHWVSLAGEISGEEVTVAADDWKALVAVAGGLPVGSLGSRLELGELPIARLLKSLSDLGVVEVSLPRDDVEIEVVEVEVEVDADDEVPLSVVADDAPAFDPDALVVGDADPGAGAPPPPSAADDAEEDVEPGEAAEIARQLANLSPKAARAVAAAAQATTDEERDAALAEVEESDEQINRDLLLKFLGTV